MPNRPDVVALKDFWCTLLKALVKHLTAPTSSTSVTGKGIVVNTSKIVHPSLGVKVKILVANTLGATGKEFALTNLKYAHPSNQGIAEKMHFLFRKISLFNPPPPLRFCICRLQLVYLFS